MSLEKDVDYAIRQSRGVLTALQNKAQQYKAAVPGEMERHRDKLNGLQQLLKQCQSSRASAERHGLDVAAAAAVAFAATAPRM